MKILFLSDVLNEISGAGNLSRIHRDALLQLFGKENFFEVSLAAVNDKDEFHFRSYKQVNGLYKKVLNIFHCLPLKMNPEVGKYVVNIINENDIDILFVDNSIYGKTLCYIKKKVPRLKVISFYHDVKRELYKQWLKERGIKYFPWFCIGIYGEYLNQKYSDINIVLNQRETELYRRYYKKYPEAVIPISVNEPSVYCCNPMKRKIDVNMLFIGAYYEPNLIGLDWFINNVFPELPNNYILTVVGRDMERVSDIYKKYGPRIRIVGTVNDLENYYQESNCVIAPIFDGGGMKVKTAEAFSYGKPFIGTLESLEGYLENIPNHLLGAKVFCCVNKDEMVKAIKSISVSDGYDDEIKSIYTKYYSLDALINSFNRLIVVSKDQNK